MKKATKFKRILSGVLSAIMTVSAVPIVSAHAEESTEPYPYTMFAVSNSDGAITINADNVCINGSIATNGTIVTTSPNFNVNGTKTENANEGMLYIQKKLNYSYFSGDNVEMYADDYTLEDQNININNPMDVNGTLEMTGNINMNSGIKALEDVNLNGEVKNTNNSVIFSETGDININTSNTNFNGLIYAPYGDIVIDTDNLNLNNVVIIGQTITLDCPSINANYSTYMAELVGTESDIDVEIYAMGEYNSEANSIDIEWYTNYENSSYEIWISDDNEEYTSVGVVSDGTAYQYPITEDFEKRYFKISLTTNYGEYIESVPFVVTKTEEGYFVDFLDSDDDGIPDVFEIMIGTDINVPDTDNDGLTDYQEVYITGTDPTKFDSVTEGVSDSDADSDGDGLSNAQEINHGTDPQLSDTDGDNLSDYDEINVYGTDPLKPDTDDDGLDDDSELKFELDPNNPETHGIPDSEYQISQSISSDNEILSSINTEDSPFELSIDIKTNRDAEKELSISQSAYSNAIENDAMIGASLDFSISDTCNPKEIVLKYNIKEAYIDNTLNLYSSLEEFQGIKRLNIFKFDEDKNMLLPIETEFDVENGLLYAEVDELGTYCIMDMEIWLNNLGVKMPEESQPEENAMYFSSPSILSASENSGSGWKPTYVNAPIDLVFILQSAGTSNKSFATEKELIQKYTSYVFKNYENVNVIIVTFNKNTSNILKSSLNNMYLKNSTDVYQALNKVNYTYEPDYCDREQAFSQLLNNNILREDSDKFVYKLVNGKTKSYLYNEHFNMINGRIGNYSEIFPEGWHYVDYSYGVSVKGAIEKNGNLFISLGDETFSKLTEHLEGKLSPARPVYEIIIPTKWKKISLKEKLSPYSSTDTDGDTLTDWEEVDTTRLIWNVDGSFEIPTFNIAELVNHINRFQSSDYNFLSDELTNNSPRHYLPILSDPTEKDSDGDGLLDGESQYYNGKNIAPPDPDKLKMNGPKNIWKTHIEQIKNDEKWATEYSYDYYKPIEPEAKLKFLWHFIPYIENNFSEVFLSKISALGSDVLDFRYDENHIALHSDIIQWQAIGGYNDFYDLIFNEATSMKKIKLDFNYGDYNYVVWAWKGNYLSLGAGSEVGFYKQDKFLQGVDKFTGLEHWMVADTLPMSLSLYKKSGYSYYHWFPDMEQWWITGFVPDEYNWWFDQDSDNFIKEDQLVQIASVDFSNFGTEKDDTGKTAYERMKKKYEEDPDYKNNLIFDDKEQTLWIVA